MWLKVDRVAALAARRPVRSRLAWTQRCGFTLIELLVVVAIIAVLMAIFIPSLARVKEQAKTTLCASNMRQIGGLIYAFAADHQGRGPGYAHDYQGAAPGSISSGNGIGWSNILDIEVLGRRSNDKYGVGGQSTGAPSVEALSCPKKDSPYYGSYEYNLDASGGPVVMLRGDSNDPGSPYFSAPYVKDTPTDQYHAGPFGMSIDPKSVFAGLNPDGSKIFNYYNYNLGAILSRFKPTEFLLVEVDDNNGTTDWTTADYAYKMSPGQSLAFPNTMPYTTFVLGGSGGNMPLSFRHPYKKNANFLFFDNHIETLTPKDDVYIGHRYGMPY